MPDGTPAKKYKWICWIDRQEQVIHLQGTINGPPLSALVACRDLARTLGCNILTWDREKNGKIIKVHFTITNNA